MTDLLTFLPSIQNDACIIEEQPEHVVVAIRIPRRWLTANMSLLAELADRSGASDMMSAPIPGRSQAEPPRARVGVITKVYRRLAGSFGL